MGNEEEETETETETESGVGRVAELLSLRLPPLIRSRQHSGTLTPPLHTQVSVPFRWEEEPGKPLPSLALLHSSNNAAFVKSLELPPRLLINDCTNKTPSPTTVLDGPDTYTYTNTNTNTTTSTSLGIGMGMGRSLLESSSLRFLSLRKRGQASFDGDTRTRTRTPGSSPDRGLLGAIILSNSGTSNKMKMKMKMKKKKEKGTWGSWRKTKGNKTEEGDDGNENCVFSTFSDDETSPTCHSAHTVKVSTTTSLPINTNRSLSTLSCANSHFWATIYGALKQVIPRRSAKLKNDAL